LKRFARVLGCCVLCVALVMGLTACTTGSKDVELTSQVSSSAVVNAGYLTVGVDSTSAPYAGEHKGSLVGIDVDTAAALADALGLKLKLVDINAEDAATELTSGAVDVVMSWNNTGSSSTSVTTVGSYLTDGTALFGISVGGTIIQVDKTTLQGVKIGTQAGSVSVTTAGSYCGYANVSTYNTLDEAFAALESGEVTYVACNAVAGSYLATSYDDIAYAGMLDTATNVTMAVSSSNTTLQTALSSALTTIKSNGTLKVSVAKWLGMSTAVKLIPTT
jgi:polar amino acid transport system substrate-binding protein